MNWVQRVFRAAFADYYEFLYSIKLENIFQFVKNMHTTHSLRKYRYCVTIINQKQH